MESPVNNLDGFYHKLPDSGSSIGKTKMNQFRGCTFYKQTVVDVDCCIFKKKIESCACSRTNGNAGRTLPRRRGQADGEDIGEFGP